MKLLRKRSLLSKGLPLFIFALIISHLVVNFWVINPIFKGITLVVIWGSYAFVLRHIHLYHYDLYYRADALILKNKLEERWIDFSKFVKIESDGSDVRLMGASEYGYVITFKNEKNDYETVSIRDSFFNSNLEDFFLFVQRERPDFNLF